jgi:hypothetical protein
MTKTFDAIELSCQLREKTSRQLAKLSREQRIALINSHIRTQKRAETPVRR